MDKTREQRDKEAQTWWDDLYPVGKENWFKIRIVDQDKAMKILMMSPSNNEKSKKLTKEQGFEITAIGIVKDYEPMLSSLQEMKEKIFANLYGILDDYQKDSLSVIMKDVMDRFYQENVKKI